MELFKFIQNVSFKTRRAAKLAESQKLKAESLYCFGFECRKVKTKSWKEKILKQPAEANV